MELMPLINSVLLYFLAMTSKANNKPPSALPNNSVTPAITPAQISSVL
nr:hypothetical protein [Sphingobacterium sp. E70]